MIDNKSADEFHGGESKRGPRKDGAGRLIDNKYRIESVLGSGGMGTVYLAQHLILKKRVAIKFLQSECMADETLVQRFYREAQAAAAIGHPNIIDVLDVGATSDNEPYLVMEYLQGESLGDLIRRSAPLELSAARTILTEVCGGLEAAHAKGIIHRDLKPENIFIAHRSGHPPLIKLIDFGISKMAEDDGKAKLTQTGAMLGTPTYMSPEQLNYGSVTADRRTDVFALGVILFEMLTGVLPFEGSQLNEVIIKIATADHRDPRESVPELSDDIVSVIDRVLAKQPEDRYQSVVELCNAFDKAVGSGVRKASLREISPAMMGNVVSAVGELGAEHDVNTATVSASEIMDGLRGRAVGELDTDGARFRRRFRRAMIVAGIGLVLSAAVGIFFFSRSSRDGAPLPPNTQEEVAGPRARAKSPVPDTPPPPTQIDVPMIELTLEGIPADARLFMGNTLLVQRPVKIAKGMKFTAFRVEAEGFEPYEFALVPSGSQTVQIEMKKLPAQKKASRPSRKKRKPRARENATTSTVKETKKSKRFTDGPRGAQLAEDFE